MEILGDESVAVYRFNKFEPSQRRDLVISRFSSLFKNLDVFAL